METREILKELRKSRGLSARGLAEKTGFSHTTISRMESGVTNVSVDQLKKFAVLFHVSSDYLLGLKESKGLDYYLDNLNNINEYEEEPSENLEDKCRALCVKAILHLNKRNLDKALSYLKYLDAEEDFNGLFEDQKDNKEKK